MKFSVLALFLVLFYSCQAQGYVFSDLLNGRINPNHYLGSRQSQPQYNPRSTQSSRPRNPGYQPNVGSRRPLIDNRAFFNTFGDPVKNFRDILSRGTTQLTLNIDKILERQQNPSNNIVFSPLSLQMLLANILMASKGQTFDEIVKIFNINSDVFINSEKDFHKNFGKLIEQTFHSTNQPGAPKVNYGTGVFLTNDLLVGSPFELATKEYYKTHSMNINYRNGAAAQQIINNWVKSKTQGLISSILDQQPSYDTKAIIASALYFKGEWENRFDGSIRSTFAVNPSQKISVNMMHSEGDYPYYYDKNLDLEIISLPYKSSEVSMYVAIPKQVGTVALKKMKSSLTPNVIDGLIGNMQSTNMKLFLPKMDLSTDLDFTEILNQMGLTSLTDRRRADLSLLTAPGQNTIDNLRRSPMPRNLHISFDQIVQKVKMSVSEEGTEAAAVSGALGFRSLGPDLTVKADHPFLFFIRNNETKTILFYGSINNPNQN